VASFDLFSVIFASRFFYFDDDLLGSASVTPSWAAATDFGGATCAGADCEGAVLTGG